MKEQLSIALACLAIVSGAGCSKSESAAGLRVGSQQTYAPIEYLDGGERPVGLSVDLLDEVGRRIGQRITFVNANYSALVPGLEVQRFDIASGGITDTKERQEKVDFVNYLGTGASILVRREDGLKYRTLDDFCGKKVAALLGGWMIIGKVEEASRGCQGRGMRGVDVLMFPATTDAYFQLWLGRVDAYLGDLPALRAIIDRTGDNYVVAQGDYIFIPYTTSWAFRKGDPLARRFLAAMQDMHKDGTYQAILDKWKFASGGLSEITMNHVHPDNRGSGE